MASHFWSHPVQSHERNFANTLFYIRLQVLYRRRHQLARAARRAQLEGLDHDLRELYSCRLQHFCDNSAPGDARGFIEASTSHVVPTLSFLAINETGKELTQKDTRNEKILLFANDTTLNSSASLTRITSFHGVLKRFSNAVDMPGPYSINPLISEMNLSANCLDQKAAFGELVTTSQAPLRSSTDRFEDTAGGKYCPSISDLNVMSSNVTNKTGLVEKCELSFSQDHTIRYYNREFDSLCIGGSHSTICFDVSEREQTRHCLEYMQMAEDSSRRTVAGIQSRPVCPAKGIRPRVERWQFCNPLSARDRLVVSSKVVQNSKLGVIFLPSFRSQSLSANLIFESRTNDLYFMNFGRLDFGVGFLDERPDHAAYAPPKMLASKYETCFTNSNPLALTYSSAGKRPYGVPEVNNKDRRYLNAPVGSFKRRTALASTSFGLAVYPLPPSHCPHSPTSIANAYFNISKSPLFFVVPRISDDEHDWDELVMEINEEGQAICE